MEIEEEKAKIAAETAKNVFDTLCKLCQKNGFSTQEGFVVLFTCLITLGLSMGMSKRDTIESIQLFFDGISNDDWEDKRNKVDE